MPTAGVSPAWSPQQTGVQQICYLLSEYQKPGSNQSQVDDVHVPRSNISTCYGCLKLLFIACEKLCTFEVTIALVRLPHKGTGFVVAQMSKALICCRSLPNLNNAKTFLTSTITWPSSLHKGIAYLLR